jgi:hypothetical protein
VASLLREWNDATSCAIWMHVAIAAAVRRREGEARARRAARAHDANAARAPSTVVTRACARRTPLAERNARVLKAPRNDDARVRARRAFREAEMGATRHHARLPEQRERARWASDAPVPVVIHARGQEVFPEVERRTNRWSFLGCQRNA